MRITRGVSVMNFYLSSLVYILRIVLIEKYKLIYRKIWREKG